MNTNINFLLSILVIGIFIILPFICVFFDRKIGCNKQMINSFKNNVLILKRNPIIAEIEISNKSWLCVETTAEKFEEYKNKMNGLYTDEDIKPGFVFADFDDANNIHYMEIVKLLDNV